MTINKTIDILAIMAIVFGLTLCLLEEDWDKIDGMTILIAAGFMLCWKKGE